MEDKYRKLIASEFENCVANTIERLKGRSTSAPFHEALLSKDALFWSGFERSFSTSFGQRTIEEVSKYAALSGGASDAGRQKVTGISIDANYMRAINGYRNARGRAPRWEESLGGVLSAGESGRLAKENVISDLWWRKDGIDNYMSIKTVMPNIDQTVQAKKDCLKLSVNDPSCKAYFGLYYNPFGPNRSDYRHNPPMSTFDFHRDPVVLIGKEYWDTLGGPGFYEEILDIAREVGCRTRPMIEALSKAHAGQCRLI